MVVLADSHYISAFCEHNGPKRLAVCGRWIRADEHSAEPTCADCAAWLMEDRADTRTADEVFGEPEPDLPRTRLTPDTSLEGYRMKGRRR